MTIGNNEELLNIVSNAPVGICVLDAATLITEMVNDAFLEVARKPYDAVYGIYYWDSFPEVAPYYEAVLANVVKEGKTYRGDEVEQMLIRKGQEEWIHVTFVYEPVKGKDGAVQKVAIWVLENTQQVKARNEIQRLNDELEERVAKRTEELAFINEEMIRVQQSLQQLNDELEERVSARTVELLESENRFRSLIEQMPAAINVFQTQDLIVDLPNERMLEIWGRTFDEVNGKPLDVGIPELKGQPFMQKLRDVITTGIPYSSSEEKALIQRNDMLEELYFNITYQPIVNEDGTITSCVQIASDVTEAITSRRRIQALNEELAAANEELLSANEELATSGEEQIQTNQQLTEALQQVARERQRLNTFFMQAPAGICILGGPELIYELVNPGYQQLLPGRDLQNRPIFEALPELVGTPLQQVLLDVYQKSLPATFIELLIPIAEYERGPEIERYFTFHYIPRKNDAEETDGIMAFVYEVTDQVKARKKVERAEERLRIATESAELGTWSYYPDKDKLIVSSRFREIFGMPLEGEVVHQEKLSMIHPDYQPVAAEALKASIDGDSPLLIEYPITVEGKQKWVRVAGKKVQEESSAIYVTGVASDLSEQKRDEQRKNDFIGMVSHEMKTPLTSLNGYLQLLRMRSSNEDAFVANMLDKSNKQIARITTLINGFLNVSRLESGKIHIDKQRFDMAQLIKEAQDEVQSTINSHKVVFAPVQTTWVNADRDKINQVISNLVSNAVKYSPANTEINVACITIDGNTTVSVRDEGIGIKEEDQDKLFDRYYRVNHDSMTSPSGFGIGLYLCAEIIQRHDGKIWVESEVNKGSTFLFSLPVVA